MDISPLPVPLSWSPHVEAQAMARAVDRESARRTTFKGAFHEKGSLFRTVLPPPALIIAGSPAPWVQPVTFIIAPDFRDAMARAEPRVVFEIKSLLLKPNQSVSDARRLGRCGCERREGCCLLRIRLTSTMSAATCFTQMGVPLLGAEPGY